MSNGFMCLGSFRDENEGVKYNVHACTSTSANWITISEVQNEDARGDIVGEVELPYDIARDIAEAILEYVRKQEEHQAKTNRHDVHVDVV